MAAAALSLTVKLLRRLRCEGRGPRFRKLNKVTVRYEIDLQAFLAVQPTGGGAAIAGDKPRRSPERPRKAVTL